MVLSVANMIRLHFDILNSVILIEKIYGLLSILINNILNCVIKRNNGIYILYLVIKRRVLKLFGYSFFIDSCIYCEFERHKRVDFEIFSFLFV